jgi:hypothetical protein
MVTMITASAIWSSTAGAITLHEWPEEMHAPQRQSDRYAAASTQGIGPLSISGGRHGSLPDISPRKANHAGRSLFPEYPKKPVTGSGTNPDIVDPPYVPIIPPVTNNIPTPTSTAPAVVPIPAAGWLLLSGLSALGLAARRG